MVQHVNLKEDKNRRPAGDEVTWRGRLEAGYKVLVQFRTFMKKEVAGPLSKSWWLKATTNCVALVYISNSSAPWLSHLLNVDTGAPGQLSWLSV